MTSKGHFLNNGGNGKGGICASSLSPLSLSVWKRAITKGLTEICRVLHIYILLCSSKKGSPTLKEKERRKEKGKRRKKQPAVSVADNSASVQEVIQFAFFCNSERGRGYDVLSTLKRISVNAARHQPLQPCKKKELQK